MTEVFDVELSGSGSYPTLRSDKFLAPIRPCIEIGIVSIFAVHLEKRKV